MAGRILTASDLATSRILLRAKLSAASYSVSQAETGAELLQRAARELPDLAIIDSAFDGDRAIDLCLELKAAPQTAMIPVLIIARNYRPADRIAALNAGAHEVLPAPLSQDWLLASVRNILRSSAVERELTERRKTVSELGFREPAEPFRAAARILLVAGNDSEPPARWAELLRKHRLGQIGRIDSRGVLEQAMAGDAAPDLIILPPAGSGTPGGHALLAELRSRPGTRHTAIGVTCTGTDCASAIAALDMGANEILPADMPSAELLFRLKRLLQRKREGDRLRSMLEDGLRLAVTDPLTGLFNRRYALPHLERVARNAARTGSPFAVMVLDLDRFKAINDTHGHATGDLVLREVAARLRSNLRSVDLVARIGGEEFLVVLPDTDLATARIAAERLRRVICERPIAIGPERAPITVTASIGVSIGGQRRLDAATVQSMVERADRALLGAKATGRNQVIFGKSAA